MQGTQHLSYDGSIDRFDSLNLGSYKSMIYPLFQRLLHIIFLFHSHLLESYHTWYRAAPPYSCRACRLEAKLMGLFVVFRATSQSGTRDLGALDGLSVTMINPPKRLVWYNFPYPQSIFQTVSSYNENVSWFQSSMVSNNVPCFTPKATPCFSAQEGSPGARASSTMSHSSGSVADRPSSGILLEVPSAMAPHLANDEKDTETNRTG